MSERAYTAKEIRNWIKLKGYTDSSNLPVHSFGACMKELADALDEIAALSARESALREYVDFLSERLSKTEGFLVLTRGWAVPDEVIERGKVLRAAIGRNEEGGWTK